MASQLMELERIWYSLVRQGGVHIIFFRIWDEIYWASGGVRRPGGRVIKIF